MFAKLKNSLHIIWRRALSGSGNCANCGCGQYKRSGEGDDGCKCGHSYADHW